MAWVLDKSRPLGPQICEQVCLQIALGQLKPNERLYSVRGSGWYVAEDISPAMQTLKNLWAEKTAAYFAAMEALGMTPQAIKDYVEEWTI